MFFFLQACATFKLLLTPHSLMAYLTLLDQVKIPGNTYYLIILYFIIYFRSVVFIATCTVYMCTLTAHSLPTVTFVCFLLLLLSSSPPTSAGCQPYSEVQENYTQFIPICQQTASSNCNCSNGQQVSHIGSIVSITFSTL